MSVTDSVLAGSDIPHVCAGLCTKCGEIQTSSWECGCDRVGDHPYHQIPADAEDLTEAVELEELLSRLGGYLRSLRPGEARVIHLRFGLDGSDPLNPGEVAALFGVKRHVIVNVERRAILKLWRKMSADGWSA